MTNQIENDSKTLHEVAKKDGLSRSSQSRSMDSRSYRTIKLKTCSIGLTLPASPIKGVPRSLQS